MPGPQPEHDGVRERGHGGGGAGQRDQQRVHHLQRRAVLQVPAVLPLPVVPPLLTSILVVINPTFYRDCGAGCRCSRRSLTSRTGWGCPTPPWPGAWPCAGSSSTSPSGKSNSFTSIKHYLFPVISSHCKNVPFFLSDWTRAFSILYDILVPLNLTFWSLKESNHLDYVLNGFLSHWPRSVVFDLIFTISSQINQDIIRYIFLLLRQFLSPLKLTNLLSDFFSVVYRMLYRGNLVGGISYRISPPDVSHILLISEKLTPSHSLEQWL